MVVLMSLLYLILEVAPLVQLLNTFKLEVTYT